MAWFLLDGTPASTISFDSRAFLYGDGFFTTLRVLTGKPQLLRYHVQRLLRTADALQLTLDSHAIQSAVLAQADKIENGIIKVHVARQSVANGRGYGSTTTETNVLLWVSQLPPSDALKPLLLQSTIDVALLPQRIALQPENLAGLKTLNRLENVLAATSLQQIQTEQPNISEGLVFAVNDNIIEAVSSNLFFMHDGEWFTPSLQHAGVAGTLRQAILDVMDVSIVDLPLSQLHQIDAAFLCNAVRGIQPVSQLYDTQQSPYNTTQLDTQAVTHLYDTLCDNAAFMAHFS